MRLSSASMLRVQRPCNDGRFSRCIFDPAPSIRCGSSGLAPTDPVLPTGPRLLGGVVEWKLGPPSLSAWDPFSGEVIFLQMGPVAGTDGCRSAPGRCPPILANMFVRLLKTIT